MPNIKPRVIIPKNPFDLLTLAAKVVAKHIAMGLTSPMNSFQSHSWTENGPKVASAMTLHEEAQEHSRLAEEEFRSRDLMISEIDESLKSTRDLLLSIYRDNPKELGQWGFEVDDTARAK